MTDVLKTIAWIVGIPVVLIAGLIAWHDHSTARLLADPMVQALGSKYWRYEVGDFGGFRPTRHFKKWLAANSSPKQIAADAHAIVRQKAECQWEPSLIQRVSYCEMEGEGGHALTRDYWRRQFGIIPFYEGKTLPPMSDETWAKEREWVAWTYRLAPEKLDDISGLQREFERGNVGTVCPRCLRFLSELKRRQSVTTAQPRTELEN